MDWPSEITCRFCLSVFVTPQKIFLKRLPDLRCCKAQFSPYIVKTDKNQNFRIKKR